jgi:quercetin dioxygenase-like cupin family protein
MAFLGGCRLGGSLAIGDETALGPVAIRNTHIESVETEERESDMSHVALTDVASAIDIQTGAVVSRVIFHDDQTEVTVFGFDAGEGLREHQASRVAIVQVVKGRLEFIAEGELLDAGPGFWLHMDPGAPHSLTARELTVMLLTLMDVD